MEILKNLKKHKGLEMSKELTIGEYCLAGNNKARRIYLGKLNDKHFCVAIGWEEAFNNEMDYTADTWSICIPIAEIIYEYQWMSDGRVWTVTFYTEKEVEEASYSRWTKLESSKRVR